LTVGFQLFRYIESAGFLFCFVLFFVKLASVILYILIMSNRLTRRILLFCFVFVVSSFLSSGVVFAEEISDYNVDIAVNDSGDIAVVEKIHYDFGDEYRHGIIRDIPLRYGDEGNAVDIDLKLESVTNEYGEPYEFENIDDYYYKHIRIGDPMNTITGDHWYYISYKAFGVVNSFSDHDELYWNITGNDWGVPIDKVNVSVTSPGGHSDFFDATCFTGFFGDDGFDCSYDISDDVAKFSSSRVFYSGEGISVVLGFNKGVIKKVYSVLKVFATGGASSTSFLYSLDSPDKTIRSVKSIYGVSWRLPLGKYHLKVSKFKYRSYEQDVDVGGDGVVGLEVNLELNTFFLFFDYYLPFILFIFGIYFYISQWWKKGRDPRGRGTIMPFYKPPKFVDAKGEFTRAVSPGEVGVLIDEYADLHDITATIIKFAVIGLLKIKRVKGKKTMFLGGKIKYSFIKLRDPKNGELLLFEKNIFDAIFKSLSKGEKEVKLEDLNGEFYSSLPGIKKKLYKEVVDDGLFSRDPDVVRNDYLIFSIIFFVMSLIVGVLLLLFFASPLYIILGPIVFIFAFILSFFMPKKTVYGAEMYENVLGHKMFLEIAEKDRIKKLFSPKEYMGVFQDNLPYAMIYGVEKEWAKQFDGLYEGLPSWYEGDINFADLAYDLRRLDNFAKTVYASTPAPTGGSGGWGSGYSGGGSSSWSGGSGFGGGFSGGGFGGGGGSSW